MTPAQRKLFKLITSRLGNEAVWSDSPLLKLHADSLLFLHDDPDPDFTGFARQPLFEIDFNLPIAGDDLIRHRLERRQQALLYSRSLRGTEGGLYAIAGQALLCEPGSEDEKRFSQNAALEVVKEMAQPVLEALAGLQGAGSVLDLAALKTATRRLLAA